MDSERQLEQNEPVPPEPALEALWSLLAREPDHKQATEELVQHYLPLVRDEIRKAHLKLPRHIDRQELHAAALEALFLAVRHFNTEFGVPFPAYARKRIWGAIVDRLRGLDGTPRAARKASRMLADATQAFVQRSGRHPDAQELAVELGVSDEELSKLERYAQLTKMISADAMVPTAGDELQTQASCLDGFTAPQDSPLNTLTDRELKQQLVQALKELPDRERAILVLHYNEGIRFNEIAAAMNVTESRVSQMHSRALERLKSLIRRAERRGDPAWSQ